MALLAVPIAKVYLVEHIGGGAIIHAGGGYVSHTLVPAAIVEAFGAASTALGTVGSAAAGLATSPYALTAAAVAVAAVGTYCYLYGIPAPIGAALVETGLATPAKQGLLIPAAKLAAALVLLGLAGIFCFNFYQRIREAREAATIHGIDEHGAKTAASAIFGDIAWEAYGEALWLGLNDTGTQIKGWADTLLASVKEASVRASDSMARPANAVGTILADAFLSARSWINRRFK